MTEKTPTEISLSPAVKARNWLNNRSDQLAEWCVAGSGIDPVTLIRVGARLVAKNEEFQSPKTWPSLYLALITAAQLGLEPDGPRGEAYLIPYWDRDMKCNLVQLQPGYRGLMKLITRSGVIKHIRSQVVHANDDFEVQLGSDKHLDHRPCWKGDRGAPVCVYSLVTYADGDEDYEVAPWDDVMKAKAQAKGKSPAWDTWPEQMARKFVIKRHSNQLPLDPVSQMAIDVDNISSDQVTLDVQAVIDVKSLDASEVKSLAAAPVKAADPLVDKLKARASVAKPASKPDVKAEAPVKAAPPVKAAAAKAAPAEEAADEALKQCELCGEEVDGAGDVCGACAESVREAERD